MNCKFLNINNSIWLVKNNNHEICYLDFTQKIIYMPKANNIDNYLDMENVYWVA